MLGAASREAPVLAGVLAFLGRRWIELLLTMAVTITMTLAMLQALPARYTARADVLLDPRRDKAFGPDDAAASATMDPAVAESAIALIKSHAVLARAVRTENLAGDPDFNGRRAGTLHLPDLLGLLVGHREPLETTPEHYAVGALFRAIKVERVGKAYVLSISATARDPGLAARLANAVASGFVHDQTDARLEATRREATFFAERLEPLGAHLRRSEEALERFRRDHDLIATVASGQAVGRPGTLNEQQLGDLNGRLAQARADTALAWAHYDGARATVAGGRGMEAIPDVVASPLVTQLRQQQAEVARKEADLAARYSDSYPALIDARAERREIERAIAREMAHIVANLKGAYDIAKSHEDGLRADVTLATGAAGLDSDLAHQLSELERVKLIDQTVFETYLGRARAAEQQATFEEHDARVISPAVPPNVAAYPQRKIVLFCALLLGGGLGVALGLARDALAAGFVTPEAAESALRLPVLTCIPWLPAAERTFEGRVVDPARLPARCPHGPYAEAIHALRAQVGDRGQGGCVILVASALPGEGKTMLALSLALSATLAGQRVLLVDADLRSPTLSRSFGAENRLGLVDMLAGLVGTEETTVPLAPGLAIMPAGRRPVVAPDLFGSKRMALYVEHLRDVYDLVIVDSPALQAAVDAAVLARLSDRILFVVGWRDSAAEAVARALQRVGQPHKLAGLVFNKLRGPVPQGFGARGGSARFGGAPV